MQHKTRILLTGATGYIGSHTWLALWEAGFDVVGIDNFCNSSPGVLERLREIGGREPEFIAADICDARALDAVLNAHRIEAVVHFAALKAVGESVAQPLRYYRNNVGGLIQVCDAMLRHGCHRVIYSSSATVYGEPQSLPIRENAPLAPVNPYGWSKLFGEQVLADLGAADACWQTACLRYFNPVGAHESGLIGEDPRGTPNNLMPYIAQVAIGRRPRLSIFGNDYPTLDGTGVRDYIHVCDLAEGHVAAVRRLLGTSGSVTVNLGTGRGHSVLEVVRAYERNSGRTVPFEVVPRRIGDVAECYADAETAYHLLDWRASRDLEAMCADSWRWQQRNPDGLQGSME
jgi:UDP-glucose 4-epimerase